MRPDLRVAHGVQPGAAMVVDDALRVAGGARGVVQRDGLPFVGRPERREILVAFVEQRLVVELAQPLLGPSCSGSTMSMTSGGRSSCASASRITGANSVSVSSALASPCSQDEGDGGGVEPGVQRVEDGAGHRHAVMRLQHRRRVGRHHRHRIAGRDAARRSAEASRRQRARSSAIGPAQVGRARRPCARDRCRRHARGSRSATAARSWRRSCRDRRRKVRAPGER